MQESLVYPHRDTHISGGIMRKSIHLLVVLLASQIGMSQRLLADALYSNASPDPTVPGLNPRLLSKSGVAAPAGTYWSEAQNPNGDLTQANTDFGFTSYDHYWMADDFTVPAPGWTLDG